MEDYHAAWLDLLTNTLEIVLTLDLESQVDYTVFLANPVWLSHAEVVEEEWEALPDEVRAILEVAGCMN